MKTLSCLGLAFAASLAAPLFAQSSAPSSTAVAPAAAGVPSSSSASELAALEQFLNLSTAELAQMEAVLARLRAMTPDQRAALRAEIAAFRALPEPQRLQLRQGWGAMPDDIQAGWRDMMQSASPERRREIQARLQSLDPDEKMRYRRELVEAYLKASSPRH
jgi:hypothetical protein